jgi:hypothetical protein
VAQAITNEVAAPGDGSWLRARSKGSCDSPACLNWSRSWPTGWRQPTCSLCCWRYTAGERPASRRPTCSPGTARTGLPGQPPWTRPPWPGLSNGCGPCSRPVIRDSIYLRCVPSGPARSWRRLTRTKSSAPPATPRWYRTPPTSWPSSARSAAEACSGRAGHDSSRCGSPPLSDRSGLKHSADHWNGPISASWVW